jgi:hypothetical protein
VPLLRRRTILQPISRLLGSVYPDAYPWHLNWKAGRTHPAIIARTTVVDHVIPGTQGGDWTDPRNMVTACWPCNSIKADPTLDQLGWTVWPISSDPWEGLAGLYRRVWEVVGRPDASYHEDWLGLLERESSDGHRERCP